MQQWKAKWVGYAYDPKQDLGVFAFRNRFNLDEARKELIAWISADNRYKLYVNGEMVAFGPQRGDERHWFYDSVDIGPYVNAGENVIVALVWNFGWMAPMAQHTVRTAFVMECEDVPGLTTPGTWEVERIEAWDFAMMHSSIGDFYIDIGPGEIIGPVLDRLVHGESLSGPRAPHVIAAAEDRTYGGGGTPWMLIPRTLPPMRYDRREAPPEARTGYSGEASNRTLYDYGELLCAYPRIRISGPQGATVTLTYAESLWNPDGTKGNRDRVEGKEMRGYQDRLTLGAKPAVYEPLWWRTYRYLLVDSDQPVTVESLEAIETGYPIEVQSSFEADDPAVEKIWRVAVRTAERCAGETYFDCPYYEQLQYAGDTRIQALIGYYLGRDRRLQANAIETLGWSIMESGLTQSRYPSRQTQVIPPFSLWWVMMLHDQVYYDRNRSYGLHADVMAANAIEAAHKAVIDKQFWNFVDWVPDWRAGVPPGCGYSVNTWLADASRIAKMQKLNAAIFSVSDEIAMMNSDPGGEEDRDLLAGFRQDLEEDTELVDGLVKHFDDDAWTASEHTEAIYRLYQSLLGVEPAPWPYAALERANAAKCTYYFSYYKHLAMRPEDYMAQLGPWKEMIEEGLSTFAENPEPTRSDCHAWSAHPILGFFQIVAGVTSTAVNWRRARIEPRPGSLKRFNARIAHPDGDLTVRYEDGKLTIDTPVMAELIWKGKAMRLEPGRYEADR